MLDLDCSVGGGCGVGAIGACLTGDDLADELFVSFIEDEDDEADDSLTRVDSSDKFVEELTALVGAIEFTFK